MAIASSPSVRLGFGSGRVGDDGPAEGTHLAPAHPGHEEEPRRFPASRSARPVCRPFRTVLRAILFHVTYAQR